MPDILVAIVAVVAGYFAGWFQHKVVSRSEMRGTYLSEAYRNLEQGLNRPPEHNLTPNIEQAISDIQLFGSDEEIGAVHRFLQNYDDGKNAPELLEELRTSFRRHIGIKATRMRIMFYRLERNADDRSAR